MKSILVSIIIAMSAHFAFAEEPSTATPTTPEAAAPAEVGQAMGKAHGNMHAAMGAKHEEMMKNCKEMHPGEGECEKMMASCGTEKNMKKCMKKMMKK